MVPRADLPYAPPAPGAAENRVRYTAHGARLLAREAQHAALLSARKHAAEV